VLDQVVRQLAVELLKKQLDDQVDPDAMDRCPACRVLLDNMLSGGADDWALSVRLSRPVIGVGAPVQFFLPRAAGLLNAKAIVPPDADVANAIGAITSRVVVSRTARIRPDETGRYAVEGLAGAPGFARLSEANDYAVTELSRLIRQAGLAAGTGQTRVRTHTRDRIATAADGTELFIERVVSASLSGRPDAISQKRPPTPPEAPGA